MVPSCSRRTGQPRWSRGQLVALPDPGHYKPSPPTILCPQEKLGQGKESEGRTRAGTDPCARALCPGREGRGERPC